MIKSSLFKIDLVGVIQDSVLDPLDVMRDTRESHHLLLDELAHGHADLIESLVLLVL